MRRGRGSDDDDYRHDTVKMMLIPHHETDGALLVSQTHDDPEDEWIWLPKSQISYNNDFQMGDIIEIEMTRWIANKKGL